LTNNKDSETAREGAVKHWRAPFFVGAISNKSSVQEVPMYSPKISEDLIPLLFRLAKREAKPMTRLVDDILRKYLKERRWLDELQSKANAEHHFREI
jgi:hypothetical protein